MKADYFPLDELLKYMLAVTRADVAVASTLQLLEVFVSAACVTRVYDRILPQRGGWLTNTIITRRTRMRCRANPRIFGGR